ncbi:hypothetical protein NQ318_004193 [Aromia moschata]|uniref:tRNA-splicing endonuclease subunit Sen54 N-terminal domain-containing protein n=1 Tax=Aromia moschata TaxID=1265417 RepID=A0AAV8Y6I4_9CUCU|nr:hypothetical protein NQ318_004193 [Aromia moschata]
MEARCIPLYSAIAAYVSLPRANLEVESSVVVLCAVLKESLNNKTKQVWIRNCLKKRPTNGHRNLLRELSLEPTLYQNFLRMNEEVFEQLSMVCPLFEKRNTRMRTAISPTERAKKLINDHKNPIVKVELPDAKLFLRSFKQDECVFIEKHKNNLETLLGHGRVERRCARSKVEWSTDNQLATVTKTVKTLLHNFGYQDRNGIFLYPEETLYLMETNRVEVTWKNVPLSIQEGYNLLFKHKCSLTQYRVYKKLVLLGYRVLRYEEIMRRKFKNKKTDDGINQELNNKSSSKRSIEECGENECGRKRLCTETTNVSEVKSRGLNIIEPVVNIQKKSFKDILEKLRTTAPRPYKLSLKNEQIPDFCVFLPNNKTRCDYDFHLFICKEPTLERKMYNHSLPAVFAISSDDNISFYKLSTINLPFC